MPLPDVAALRGGAAILATLRQEDCCMTYGPISTYMAELLYEARPHIDADAVLDELRKRCGRVDRVDKEGESYLYAFPDHEIEYEDRAACAMLLLGRPDKGKASIDVEDALQQTWAWSEARSAVEKCRASLLLSEMLARGLEYKSRLALFHGALESVLAVAPCRAIHSVITQQLIDPREYLTARESGDRHPLQHALNVRMYRITNRQPEEMLMDTMGLATLGLPDLQCHFVDLDAQQIAQVLYNAAYYVFDNGDVIQDGNTIQGIRPDDKWRCRHEMALMEPEREVIDINPGEPYAAGKRP
jgi:hypothetical protein